MEDFSKTIDLVRDANEGDPQALEDLLERYRPRIQRIVALRMGRKLNEVLEDEDIVQDTLVKVFKGLHNFRTDTAGSFRNWLACLIENEIRDRARFHSAKKRGEDQVQRLADFDDSVLTDSLLPDCGPSPSQIARGFELEEKLHEVLLGMDEKHRTVIDLRHLCGMGYDEIAKEMNLDTSAAARALFSRAMARYSVSLSRILD